MTTSNEPGLYDNMIDWLESEVHALKAQVADLTEQLQQERAQLWTFADEWERAEGAATNTTAQLHILSALPDEVRFLRERVERVQSALAHDQEQTELLARQLRAEMQAERDERGELRRRTDFAEQAALAGADRMSAADEMVRRLQETASEHTQRFEQIDINLAGLEARLAASIEALRRADHDSRTLSADLERHARGVAEMGERLDRYQEAARRLDAQFARGEEAAEEADALGDRFDALRVNNDQAMERLASIAAAHEMMDARLAESDRNQERARSRSEQHERVLNELRAGFEELRQSMQQDYERLLGFQEKQRRRQIADLEQEIRELRGYIRAHAEDDG